METIVKYVGWRSPIILGLCAVLVMAMVFGGALQAFSSEYPDMISLGSDGSTTVVGNTPSSGGGPHNKWSSASGDQWLSFGMGLRNSYTGSENGNQRGDDFGGGFATDNFRLYMNGQIHKYLKFEFNTDTRFSKGDDAQSVGNSLDMFVLDAIAKIELNDYVNIWLGRQLVPSDRAELSGPFFASTYTFNKTPFYPSDYSGGDEAGKYGRDDGVNLWGAAGGGRLQYVVGVFEGAEGPFNQTSSPLVAGRVAFNLLDVEKNPGYYTSSTYYGEGGDILTVGLAGQHQKDGVYQSFADVNSGTDFTGYSADLLFEKKLADNSVVTIEGEFKRFDVDLDLTNPTGDCFCLFDGDSFLAKGLYMLPEKIGVGQFQPYLVYTEVRPEGFDAQKEIEGGLNYVIDGHKAKISTWYSYGDINRFEYTVDTEKQWTVGLALQFQIL
mgnify:CR=1 FL=1